MNEWEIVFWTSGGLIGLFGLSFGIFWKIIADVKKSAHARLDRLETRIQDCDKICNERKNNVNDNLNGRFDQLRGEMNHGFGSLNGRIDGLILTLNGRKKDNADG